MEEILVRGDPDMIGAVISSYVGGAIAEDLVDVRQGLYADDAEEREKHYPLTFIPHGKYALREKIEKTMAKALQIADKLASDLGNIVGEVLLPFPENPVFLKRRGTPENPEFAINLDKTIKPDYFKKVFEEAFSYYGIKFSD